MCKLRDVGRINHNNAFLLKQGFGLFEYLYSECRSAAVEFVDEDDGSVGYTRQIVFYEFVNLGSKLFFFFVPCEKIGATEILNGAIDVTAISDKGSGSFYDANDSLAEILFFLDALFACSVSDRG